MNRRWTSNDWRRLRHNNRCSSSGLDFIILFWVSPPTHSPTPALKLIKELEPFERGWYAAPVGWVGYDETEFAVAIRSGLIDRDRLLLFAGAGIVKGSRSVEEWAEIENKIRHFTDLFTELSSQQISDLSLA